MEVTLYICYFCSSQGQLLTSLVYVTIAFAFALAFSCLTMATEAQIECRAEYAVGSIIFFLRWATRGKMRMWKLDDWFSVSAWVFFTMIQAMVEYLGKSASTDRISKKGR
jgi:ABC-type multidrug transport system fused ATPase/permease subunit